MKNFIALWIGEFVSGIGSGMTTFALSVYIYETTGSVSYVSAIVLASFLPMILLSPPGGALADRYDRRLLMLIGDLFSGLGILFVLFNISTGSANILYIVAGVGFNGVFAALLEPSFRAAVTDLLSKEDYAKASGMTQMASGARYLISPILAGIILTRYDIQTVLIIDICTFFVTVAIISIIRKSISKPLKEVHQGIWDEIKDGFSVLKSSKGINNLVLFMAGVCFFMGFLQTLLVPMVLALSDKQTLGILESVCAVGLVAGSVIISALGINKGYVRTLSLAGIFASVFMAMSGVVANLYVIGTGIFLFFLSLPFMNTSADVLVRNNVDNEIQGRVWGIIGLVSQIGTAFAYALSGLLADNVFEPLLAENGILADNIGRIIGTGQGRGIGLMLIISGLGMLTVMLCIRKNQNILELELYQKNDNLVEKKIA